MDDFTFGLDHTHQYPIPGTKYFITETGDVVTSSGKKKKPRRDGTVRFTRNGVTTEYSIRNLINTHFNTFSKVIYSDEPDIVRTNVPNPNKPYMLEVEHQGHPTSHTRMGSLYKVVGRITARFEYNWLTSGDGSHKIEPTVYGISQYINDFDGIWNRGTETFYCITEESYNPENEQIQCICPNSTVKHTTQLIKGKNTPVTVYENCTCNASDIAFLT